MPHPHDSWGVPDQLFGPVNDDFYAAVGRVVMLAALLDDMLLRLVWSLTDKPQSVHSGKGGAELEQICRDAVGRFSDDLRTDVLAVIDEIHETRNLRNAVVHSVWPNPTLDSAFGWRAVRPHKNDGQPTKPFPTTRAALEQLVTDLVNQIARIAALQWRGHSEKAKAYPPAS